MKRHMHRKSTIGPIQELGLSKGADAVYQSLITYGQGDITYISRHTQLSRPDIYRYIKELIEVDLVHQVIQGKRKYYEAAHPETIYTLLKDKEHTIIDQVEHLSNIYDRSKSSYSFETFAGKKGISVLYEVLVKEAKPKAQMLRIESPSDTRIIKKHYPQIYWNRASSVRKGDLDKYVITNPHAAQSRRRSINRSIKVVPKDFYPFIFDITTLTIEDKVAFIDFTQEKAFLIKDARFAQYIAHIFWMLYKKLENTH